MGYRRLAHYVGGMAEWTERGGELERVAPVAPAPRTVAKPWAWNVFDLLADAPVARLAAIWLSMVVVFALVFWAICAATGEGLTRGGINVRADLDGFWTALYFSAVTATSLGYGDVAPGGIVRLLAVMEAVAELFIFGGLVAKFVSRRQDELIREMHLTSYEDHITRVRVNLLLILRELQAIADACAASDGSVETDERTVRRWLARVMGTTGVFLGELRTIHSLLYRPTRSPDESVLDVLLTTLGGCMQELVELCGCLPDSCLASPGLRDALTRTAELADEICGDCVPRRYADALKARMDQIRDLGRQLRRGA